MGQAGEGYLARVGPLGLRILPQSNSAGTNGLISPAKNLSSTTTPGASSLPPVSTGLGGSAATNTPATPLNPQNEVSHGEVFGPPLPPDFSFVEKGLYHVANPKASAVEAPASTTPALPPSAAEQTAIEYHAETSRQSLPGGGFGAGEVRPMVTAQMLVRYFRTPTTPPPNSQPGGSATVDPANTAVSTGTGGHAGVEAFVPVEFVPPQTQIFVPSSTSTYTLQPKP